MAYRDIYYRGYHLENVSKCKCDDAFHRWYRMFNKSGDEILIELSSVEYDKKSYMMKHYVESGNLKSPLKSILWVRTYVTPKGTNNCYVEVFNPQVFSYIEYDAQGKILYNGFQVNFDYVFEATPINETFLIERIVDMVDSGIAENVVTSRWDAVARKFVKTLSKLNSNEKFSLGGKL